MGRGSASVFAVVSMSMLAACGGSDGDAGGSDTTTSTAAPDAPETAETATVITPPPITSPPTTASPTTTSSTTTTSTTTTSTPPATTAPRECLDGSWWLSPEQTTSLYAALLPGMPVTVTGTHWVDFSGGSVDYWVVLEMRFAVGGADITFGIDQHGLGSYAVVDDVLSITYDTFESNVHEGHGNAITDPGREPETYVDEAVDLAVNGDGTITINRVTLPVIDVAPVAGGPLGCDDDTMSLGFTSGLADAAAVYVRRA